MVPERSIFKGSLKKSFRKWFFKEPWFERFFETPHMVPQRTIFLKVLRDTFIDSLKHSLRKWFFKEPWFKRFFGEPEMVP